MTTPSKLALVNGVMVAIDQDPVALAVNRAKDVFGNLTTSQRTNQIEVPFNDANWANFVTATVNGGTATQADGQVTIATGTGTGNDYGLVSLDQVRYRSGAEIGWGFTFKFGSAGVANSYQRIGATTGLTWGDGVWLGYEGAASFAVTYYRNGSQVFSKPQSQWIDKCDGSAGSTYTSGGNPVALDVTKDQLCRIRAGLFGHAGFVVEILSPDGMANADGSGWVQIITYSGINVDTVPVFSDFDLRIAAEVNKNSAGSANLTITSACWAGWTGISLSRLSDVFTDRSLVQNIRGVVFGKTTGGGGGYVAVKVTPSGALTADVSGSVVALDAATLAALELVGVKGADGTNAASPTNPLNTADSTDIEYTVVATSVTAAGDNFVYTPATGKKVRIHWVYAINDPVASNSTKITIKLGSKVCYVAWAISKRQQITGPVEDGTGTGKVNINLSAGGNVAVTIFLEEV